MIYLGYNRDTDVVAHFWRDRLHEYLLGIKDRKHCPYIIIGGRKVCYGSVFEKWKDYVVREELDGTITIDVRDEVLDRLAEFESKFDDIILAKKDELEEWSKVYCSDEGKSILANIFVAIYTDFTKDIARVHIAIEIIRLRLNRLVRLGRRGLLLVLNLIISLVRVIIHCWLCLFIILCLRVRYVIMVRLRKTLGLILISMVLNRNL